MQRTPLNRRLPALVTLSYGLVAGTTLALTCAAAPPVVLPDPEVNASGSIGQSLLLHPQWLIAGAASRRTEQAGATMTTGAITLWPRGIDGVPGGQPISIVGGAPKRDQAFGASLALSDDLLLVGAPSWDQSTSVTMAGRVHLFDLASGSPVELGVITSANPHKTAQFGAAVALHVDGGVVRAAIGAPGYAGPNGAGQPTGRVSLLERNGDSWIVLAQWLLPPAEHSARFASALSMNGSTVAVGAPGGGTFGVLAEGRVLLYSVAAPNAAPVVLTAPTATLDDRFGAAVAMTDSLLVVGAPAGECDSGSAYVYRATRKGWALEASLLPPVESDAGDPDTSGWLGFGSSVAVERDRVIVGSGAFGSERRLGHRAAIFRRSGASWVLEQSIDASPSILPATGATGNVAIDPSGVVIDLPLVEPATPGTASSALRFDPQPRSADLDFDGVVGASDLAALLGAWGATGPHPADLNGNGTVDAADLGLLIGAWS